ncbi:MAG: T9SS type A sorting domain-containing protein [Saprospiraceae bacterium]|nr:T9SS type A sorting domain-containing protein [Saprospiraceae bacterium]
MNPHLMKSKRFLSDCNMRVLNTSLLLLLSGFLTYLSAQVSVSISKIDPTCNGFTNGSATATATGGTAPYTYRWNNNVVGSSLFGLGSGTYSVVATDALGVSGTANVTITSPAPISINVSFANICNGGSVTASATGGSGTYTFDWGSGRTGATQTGLGGGSYNLTVTDSKGCSAIKFVSVPAAFSVSLRIGTLQCFGDCDAAIDALTSGGTAPFTYRWNTGATTQAIVGLPSGTYSVTVTDANGCTGTASGTVTNPPQIVITTNVNAPACGSGATGSATVSATGGRPPLTYKWSNGQSGTTATGLNVGDYFVTVTDAGGCNRTAKVTVPSNAGFTVNVSSTNASCAGSNGTATATVTSGGRAPFTYKWNTGATTASISNLSAGTYTVTVTDANGCVNVASTVVNAAGSLNVNVTSTNAACGIANGTATATPTSGTAPYTYKWNTGATTASLTLLGAGTYTVTVTDAGGCTAIGSATVIQTSSFDVTVDARNITCNGGTDGGATAMVSGGSAPYTYRWSNGGSVAVIANLSAGNYTVTVTDAGGCTATKTVTITQPTAISITTSVTATTCGASNGAIATVATGGNGGYSYLWSNGATTSNITSVPAGSYTVTITDSKGCSATATATVSSSNSISLTIGSSNVTCFGGSNGAASVTVTGATGAVTYAWSNGATTASVNNLTAGTYTVTATNGGCTASKSVTITQPTEISIAISLTNPSCNTNNGSLTATASGGTPQYSYKWSNGATTSSISGLAAGTYTVTVTDANGCTKMTSQSIAPPNGPVIAIVQTTIKCNGDATGTLQANATGGSGSYTYAWSNGGVAQKIVSLVAGTYTVTVTDVVSGCRATASSTLTQPTLISLSTSVTNATCLPVGSAQVTATGGTSPYTYKWSNNATTSSIANIASGFYTVTVTDANGCTNNVTVNVPAVTSPNLKCDITITKQMTGNNSNDAEAMVTAQFGKLPYTYLWSNGATTATATGLRAITYTVTVTDGNGCTTTCSVTVPNNICDNITNGGTICCNQSICNASEIQPINETLAASGGSATAAIEYLWMYSYDSDNFDPATWLTVAGATGKNLPVNLIPSVDRPLRIIRCVRRAGCTLYKESNMITITPRAFANIIGPRNACLGQDVTFIADENLAGATYNWSFQSANITTSLTRTQTVKFTSTGVKQVTLIVSYLGCTKAQVINVNVTTCQGVYGGFVGFNASPINQKEIMLDWATSNESTESKFLIEKSVDGSSFVRIGEVASQNRANNLYRFSDVEPKMGRSFYRVRQVAMDGTEVNTTQAKKVMIGQNGQTILTYPNPAQSTMFVEVLDAENVDGTIEIYNHVGRLIQSQPFTSDQMRYQINTDNLATGSYILKIRRSDGNVQTTKITKL